jgi:hypothetical protein
MARALASRGAVAEAIGFAEKAASARPGEAAFVELLRDLRSRQ